MNLSQEKLIEIEEELNKGFISFYDFSFSLIEDLTEKNNNLKFAVVNMQIALELFLKYYFVVNNEPERVLIEKKGKIKYRDFSQVLHSYFSSETKPYAEKKHLNVILESRNAIVHRGKSSEWDDSLAEYLIYCAFFIQRLYQEKTGENLISRSYELPHKINNNIIWRNGTQNFAKRIAEEIHNANVYDCPECFSRAMVSKDYFNLDEGEELKGFQCLSCFFDYTEEYQVGTIKCEFCEDRSFIFDILNEQSGKFYLGMCLNCETKYEVRKCDNCTKYFFDFDYPHGLSKENAFCSTDCKEMYD